MTNTAPLLAALVTIPGREESVSRALESLRPQVDRIHVVCHDMTEPPEAVRRLADLWICEPDRRAGSAKLHWSREWDGIYLACDDDWVYPPDYAATMAGWVERFDRHTLVTCHGRLLPANVKHIIDDAQYHARADRETQGRWLNYPGACALAWHTSLAVPDRIHDMEAREQAALALWAQGHKVPIWLVPHPAGWLQSCLPEGGRSIWETDKRTGFAAQNKSVQSVRPWVVNRWIGEFGSRWERERNSDTTRWRHNPKLAGKALAESIGLRVPRILRGPVADLSDLKPPSVDKFVVKANEGHSGHGALPLRRKGKGYEGPGLKFKNWQAVLGLLDSRTYRGREIPLHQLEVQPYPRRLRGPWFIEEYIDGREFKCYVVGHELQFAITKYPPRGGSARFCAFDRHGAEIECPKTSLRTTSLDAPRDVVALVEASEAISRASGLPMGRFDFYEDAKGLALGEVTPFPGMAPAYLPEWDRRMLVVLEAHEAQEVAA